MSPQSIPLPLRQAATPPRTATQSLRRYATLGSRLACRRLGDGLAALRAAWLRGIGRARLRGCSRLCLGSGKAPIAGWTNIDLDGAPDVRLDLGRGLPIADRKVAWIYSEHLIEHLSFDAGFALLAECRRVLTAEGVLRIATPDLAALVHAYEHDWRDQDWVHWPGHEWIDSPARMLNQAMRGWGHEHLYDENELTRQLRRAGFADVRRCEVGRSEHPELAGLETRADSKLIVEARGLLEPSA